MLREWDLHTSSVRLADGCYATTLHDAWSIGPGTHGGYQVAVVASTIKEMLPHHPDPMVLSSYFLSPAQPGPAEVQVRVLRAGRGSTTVSAELSQHGATRLSVLATFSSLVDQPGVIERQMPAPAMPAPETCVPAVRAEPQLVDRFHLLFDPSSLGWATGSPSGEGRIQAWLRLKEDRDPDPIVALLACDALPPATLDIGHVGWAPTIELTAHVRAIPAPGWLKVAHRTRNVAGGLFEEDCGVWDSEGRLVAQSRQLVKVPLVGVGAN